LKYITLDSTTQVGGAIGFSYDYDIAGSIATDSDGIYASNYGSGSGWHGPVFYTTLPSEIGKAGQYWHIVFKVKATFASETKISTYVTVGFSSALTYQDSSTYDSDGVVLRSHFRNTSENIMLDEFIGHPAVGSTNTYTFKWYHYKNNITQIYINGTRYRNQTDPIALDQGNNILACQIIQNSTYATPYLRVQEITVSTDPSYDP